MHFEFFSRVHFFLVVVVVVVVVPVTSGHSLETLTTTQY